MDYLIATHNKGKKAELERILKPMGIDVHLPEELGITLSDPEETGKTFAENACIKAKSGCMESGMPCIADDSGLCVEALEGRPGIYTARYGGEDMSYPDKIKMLCAELEGKTVDERSAYFISTICLVYPDGKEVYAEGRCNGYIGFEPSGTNGFGFDPIFYVGDRSFASLTAEEKDKISHRGNALRKFAEIIDCKGNRH